MSTMPKKVKVSKNRKKAWRRHIDIADIEDFLEGERFNERTGFDPNVPDDELFIVDADVPENEDGQETQKPTDAKKTSKLAKLADSYRLFQKLENTSKVSAVRTRYSKRITKKSIQNDDDKLDKYWADSKQMIEDAKQKKAASRKVQTPIGVHKKDFVFDLWDKPTSGVENVNSWIPSKEDIKVPVHRFQKNSLLPSVEVPSGALSYNPDSEEHRLALEARVNTLVAEYRKDEQYKPVLVNASDIKNEEYESWLNILKSDDSDDSESYDDLDLGDESLLKGMPKPITRKQRLRKKRSEVERRMKTEEKTSRVQQSKVNQINRYKREIAEMEKKTAERSALRKKIKILAQYKPMRMSSNKFVEEDLPIQNTDELTGSLRKVKSGGNLLVDRFKSFQKRNIIETRVQQFNKRKYKLKKEVKRRHKPKETAK